MSIYTIPMRPRLTHAAALLLGLGMGLAASPASAQIATKPLTVTRAVRPIVMLALSNDHQLYKAAYDDYTDIDNDGAVELTYDNDYEYFGYFEPNNCYQYNGTDERFEPVGQASSHQCTNLWSGNFLNWATMTRIDLLRGVLYGGKRSTDTTAGDVSGDDPGETVLERALIPPDLHAFAKVYEPTGGATEMAQYVPPPYSTLDAITLCNVTEATSGESQSLNTNDNPPLIKVADGVYPVWAFTEASQFRAPCAWESNSSSQNTAPMSGDEYTARVQVCVPALEGPLCKRYPEPDAVMKPIGMLQEFGDDRSLRFALLTGSYGNNLQGGVLRRAASFVSGNDADQSDGDDPMIDDELDLDTGKFTGNPGIIKTLDSMRINKYDFATQAYTDDCSGAGAGDLENGKCTNWGNPVAEIVLEAMRYLAGRETATSFFSTDDSIYIAGLSTATWADPVPSEDWCTDCSVLAVTGGVNSFDRDQLSGEGDFAVDLPDGLNVTTQLDLVGSAEQIGTDGNNVFVLGGTGDNIDGYCYAKEITSLSDATGVCPSGGRLKGGWDVAGVSYFNYINDLRESSDYPEQQGFTTRAIDMGDGMPHFMIRAGTAEEPHWITITPMCVSNPDPDATIMKTQDVVNDGQVVLPEHTAETGWELCGLWGVYVPKDQLVFAPGTSDVVAGDIYAFWEDTPYGSNSTLDAVSRVHFCFGEEYCNQSCADEPDGNRACIGYLAPGDSGGNKLLPESFAFPDSELRVTSAPVQVYSDRNISMGYVINGLKGKQYLSWADHCDNGIGHGNGVYLEEIIRPQLDGGGGGELVIPDFESECEALFSKNKDVKDCIDEMEAAFLADAAAAGDGASGGMNWFSVANADLGISADNEDRLPSFCGRRYKTGDGGLGATDEAPTLKPPLWYATKYGGFNDLNANNQPDLDDEWDSDADGNPDGYHMLYAPQDIGESFDSILDLIAGVSSSSSVVANSLVLQTGTNIYQGRFDSGSWTGDLVAFPVLSDGSLGDIDWSAKDEIEAQFSAGTVDTRWDSERVIMTSTDRFRAGQRFRWADLSQDQQDLLNRNPITDIVDAPIAGSDNDTIGADRLNYIRGDRSNELQQGGPFRDRIWLFADVVNSDPVYVGRPPYRYPDDMMPSLSYQQFIEAHDQADERTPMLYVGANDGMLHGIDARAKSDGGGEERLAYVPRAVYEELPWLTSLEYIDNHRFFVDGNLVVGDVTYGGWWSNDYSWHTILVGTLGGGGKGVFALDITEVTDASPFTETQDDTATNVLWDITASDNCYQTSTPCFPDLGYTFSAPAIFHGPRDYYYSTEKPQYGTWLVGFGNGYGSDNGNATLYLVSAGYGALVDTITVPVPSGETAGGNGLSSIAPVDIDGDFRVDYIYAGDLKGHIWRFEPSTYYLYGKWTLSFNGKPLFTAKDEHNTPQSITIRPDVFKHERGGVMVVFGTGKYFEDTDAQPDTSKFNSIYGVWDPSAVDSLVGRSFDGNVTPAELLEQEFLAQATKEGFDVRVTSTYPMTWYAGDNLPAYPDADGYLGWRLDLKDPSDPESPTGEMIVADIVSRGARVIFTTMIPSEEPCDYGGDGWMIELSSLSGGRPDGVLFDLDWDGGFSATDMASFTYRDKTTEEVVTANVAPNAKKSSIGVVQQPALVSAGSSEYKFSSGGMPAAVEVTRENPGQDRGGRQSWLQLR